MTPEEQQAAQVEAFQKLQLFYSQALGVTAASLSPDEVQGIFGGEKKPRDVLRDAMEQLKRFANATLESIDKMTDDEVEQRLAAAVSVTAGHDTADDERRVNRAKHRAKMQQMIDEHQERLKQEREARQRFDEQLREQVLGRFFTWQKPNQNQTESKDTTTTATAADA